MRRGAQALLARALLARGAAASSTLPAAAGSALTALQGALPLPPQAPPPLLPARPFVSSSITALFDAQQHDDAPHEEQHHGQRHEGGWQRHPQRQRRSGPPPDSPLGRLSACRTVEDLRAWKEGLETFGPPELAALVRTLLKADSHAGKGSSMRQGSQAFMKELLELAADGGVELDGKAAAYLVWGAAKAKLRGSDPAVQRIVPLVFQHIDTMRANDMSSLLWALGLLGIKPNSAQRVQLRNRLLPLLPEETEGAMRMKELTAAAVGATRLRLSTDVTGPLVEAFDRRITTGAAMTQSEATRMVKVLPHLPHLEPSSPLPLAVFDCLLTNAHNPATKLHSLADMAFAAGKMGCCFDGADVERLLSCANEKLGQNFGPQVHTLLHGLGLMGLRASDAGPVTHEFVSDCVDSQLGQVQQPQHMARIISAVGVLRATVPEEHLQRLLDRLSASGLDSLPEWQARMALIGFKRLRFQPGVEALEPFVRFAKQEQQQQQQQQEEAAAPEQEEDDSHPQQEQEQEGAAQEQEEEATSGQQQQ